ncbi:hypothetical protein LVJ94_17350 [Pendulispora rubella]|uniref:Uncharacterized protein n=1 Tax=Pendulispora rubella TaxID=2741070 RepID=A0ABZ2LGT6_9BACT
MDINSSLSDYKANVVEHVLAGRARARMLEDLRDGKPWTADLERGELQLGSTTFRVEILGTFSFKTKTFLWAWANPGAMAWSASLGSANALRAWGKQFGQAVFAETEILADRVNPNELAYVSAELVGGYPVFVGSYDGGAAFMLLKDLRLELEQLPLAYLQGIILDLPAFTHADPRECIRSFLRRLGFALVETSSAMKVTRSDANFVIEYDEQGRIAKISGSMGQATPKDRPQPLALGTLRMLVTGLLQKFIRQVQHWVGR